MTLRFEHPWWLALLALVLPITFWGITWLRGMAPLRRWTAILLRTALVVLVAGLLAGPHSVRTTHALATVAVIDVSDSVRRYYAASLREGNGGPTDAFERIGAFLRKAAEQGSEIGGGRGPEDLLGIVIFDGGSISVRLPSRREVEDLHVDQHIAPGTNIADAIRLARSIVPANAAGRIVLFSDGNQTTGDALDAAARVKGTSGAQGTSQATTPIDVVPLRYIVKDEVTLEQVDAPPSALAASTISVRVMLSATAPARGFLRLFMDGAPVDISLPGQTASGTPSNDTSRPIQLVPGQNIERIEVKLDDRRVHRFRAVFEPETVAGDTAAIKGDTVIENNTGEAFTLSPGRGAVLLADGVGDGDENGRGALLASTLRHAGMNVKLVPPAGVPRDLLALEEYDVVILQDVPADALGSAAAANLAVYVQDLGGGLVMIGGPSSFGAGGWKGSPLEPLLPVSLDLPERLLTTEVAIVFVLDNSGSMWRPVLGSVKTQQEIANDAAALAIRTLDRRDLIGVIAFNSRNEELISLAPNTDPAKSVEIVRGISSGGGTNAGPALNRAGEWLRAVKAKTKHIVFLSDGRSMASETLPGLCRSLAADGIKVSTIAVGDDADEQTMKQMANDGGGTPFYVTNPNMLPQIFVKAVRIVRTPLIREEPFTPIILPTGSSLLAGITSPPDLLGLSLTQPRSEPTVINAMVTKDGEPVLAHWQAGLGQVAAFTSDAGRWAQPWVSTPIYERFWKQLVRGVARTSAAAQGIVASVQPVESADGAENGGLRIRLTSRAADGTAMDGIGAKVTLYAPGDENSEAAPIQATLIPTGPGTLEAVIPATAPGSYVAVVKPTNGTKTLTPVIAGASINEGSEFRFRQSNEELLRAIAQRSGGRVLDLSRPMQAGLFDRAGIPRRESLLPLWPVLLWFAMGLALVDIANRRVAWDRWVSSLFGVAPAPDDPAASKKAAANIATLRASAEQREEFEERDAPAIALGEAEAKHLAIEARDRRRAARLAAHAPPAPIPAPGSSTTSDEAPITTATPSPPEQSGLLAAKRRAIERFNEDEDGATG